MGCKSCGSYTKKCSEKGCKNRFFSTNKNQTKCPKCANK